MPACFEGKRKRRRKWPALDRGCDPRWGSQSPSFKDIMAASGCQVVKFELPWIRKVGRGGILPYLGVSRGK